MRSAALAASPLLASVLWVAAMLVEPGRFHPAAVLLVGVGLLAGAAVGMVGMVVSAGRWAWKVALISMAATLVPALVVPIGTIWGIALASTAAAVAGLFAPSLRAGLRRRPAGAGPPPRAVACAVLLVLTPLLVGAAGWKVSGPGELVVGLSAPLAALWFVRVLPGGLLALRLLWPVSVLALLPALRPLPALAAGITAVLVLVLAWHPSVKTAFHPPQERGSAYPIPPELTPTEVLHEADIDERGRPR